MRRRFANSGTCSRRTSWERRCCDEHLHRNGIKISNGTIVDATIIGAPSSTKNKEGKRDPEMHQGWRPSRA
jgi:hypothetical protein